MRWTYDDGGRAAAGFTGKRAGDCVTRAIAIATGRNYAAVYNTLNELEAAQPRRTIKRGSARTGINKDVIRIYMEQQGWRWVPTMQVGQGCTVHLCAAELPAGRLVVSVSRHLVAMIDGVIHDTHDPSRDGLRCVYGYFTKA